MSTSAGPEDRHRARHEAGTADAYGDRNQIGGIRNDTAAAGPVRDDPTVANETVPRDGIRDDNTRAFATTALNADQDTRDAREQGVYAEREYSGDAAPPDPGLATRETVVAREKEQFGGFKVGSAFFGWLAATGMAILLTALVAVAGTAVGLATNTDVSDAVNLATTDQSVGIAGIIVLLVILLIAYYAGGYVAGRMARFSGAKQGFMVWIWALVATVVLTGLGMIAGERFNILANLNSLPRIPLNEGQLTTTGVIAAIVAAVVALIGAMLGGMAGMHYHRKVDRAGFTPTTYEDS